MFYADAALMPPVQAKAERVLLIHGWMGLPRELHTLGDALKAAGYDVTYSRHYSMFGQFEAAVRRGETAVSSDPRPVHLIGFSLGGLIARAVVEACPSQFSSLLLIGAPNAGSPLADLLSRVYPTPSLRRLRCAAPRLCDPPPGLRVGCIAGDKGGLIGRLLPGPNDSRVTLASAFDIRHDAEAIIHCSHEALRAHPDVLRHAVAFVQSGRFLEEGQSR